MKKIIIITLLCLTTIFNYTACADIIEYYDEQGNNPLHRAVLAEKEKSVKKLLALGINPNYTNDSDYSPLHLAIIKERLSVVEDLLSAGANPDSPSPKGTPFELACKKHSPAVKYFEKYGYLFYSSLWPHKNIFELLKNNGKILRKVATTPIGSNDWKFAAIALKKLFKHMEIPHRVSPLTIQQKIFKNRYGSTLIHASAHDCEQCFGKKLMYYAQKIMTKRKHVKQTLLSSIRLYNPHALQSLLNNYTISPALQYIILQRCIIEYNINCLLICLNKKFSPDPYRKEESLLHYAVRNNMPEAIQFLANHNADLTILNNKNETPLDYAIASKNKRCIQSLVNVIKQRLKKLFPTTTNIPCGLVKHLLNDNTKNGYCKSCVEELSWQLTYHNAQLEKEAHVIL